MKKFLFILMFLTGSTIYAMEDKKHDLETFRKHIKHAKEIRNSVWAAISNNPAPVETRRAAFADLVKMISQLHQDITSTDALLLPKIRMEADRLIFNLEDLKSLVLQAGVGHRNINQTPPLPPLNL